MSDLQPDKNTSVFLDGILSHAETQRRGESVGRKSWKRVRLGDYATLSAGGTPNRSVSGYYGGSIPWCSISDISSAGKFLIRTAESLTRLGIENSSAKLIPADAILFAMYASIGECTLATTSLATSQAILGIYNLKEFDREYLYYYLCSQKAAFINQGQTGTQSNLSKEILSNVQLPQPDIEEQRHIANSLSSIDANNAALQTLISKYEDIKKATVNLLLKAKDGWRQIRLGDIGEVSMCKRILKSQTSATGDVPFFKIGTFGKQPDAFISRTLFEDFKRRFSYPKVGDVLLSAAGTIGRTVVFNGEDAYFQDSNIVWISNDERVVTNPFLHVLFNQLDWQTENGGTVSRLYNSNIRNTLISIPTLDEQKRIVAILDSIDNTITGLKSQLEKSQSLKQGMMSYFFG